jgi:hypothetical protein
MPSDKAKAPKRVKPTKAKARSVRESDYAEDLKAISGELRAQAQEWMKNMPGVWSGLISSGSSEGPVFFGTGQWGAEVEDQGE